MKAIAYAVQNMMRIRRKLEQTIADWQSLSSLVEERTTQLSVYVLRGMHHGEDIPDAQRRLLSFNKALDDMFVIAVQGIELDADTEGEVIECLVNGLERVVYTMVDSYENCLLFACMNSIFDSPDEIKLLYRKKIFARY